jgi:hypothetical protein
MLHELVFGVGKKELKSFMINEERINEIYISLLLSVQQSQVFVIILLQLIHHITLGQNV